MGKKQRCVSSHSPAIVLYVPMYVTTTIQGVIFKSELYRLMQNLKIVRKVKIHSTNVKYVRNSESRKDHHSLIITRCRKFDSGIGDGSGAKLLPSESSLKPGFTNVILALSEKLKTLNEGITFKLFCNHSGIVLFLFSFIFIIFLYIFLRRNRKRSL